MNLDEDYLPTAEVAGLVAGAMRQRGIEARTIEHRMGAKDGTVRRVLSVRHVLISLDVAERMLDAVGLSLHDCPTYEVLDDFNLAVKDKHRKQIARIGKRTGGFSEEAHRRSAEVRRQKAAARRAVRASEEERHRMQSVGIVGGSPASRSEASAWDRQEQGHDHPVWTGLSLDDLVEAFWAGDRILRSGGSVQERTSRRRDRTRTP